MAYCKKVFISLIASVCILLYPSIDASAIPYLDSADIRSLLLLTKSNEMLSPIVVPDEFLDSIQLQDNTDLLKLRRKISTIFQKLFPEYLDQTTAHLSCVSPNEQHSITFLPWNLQMSFYSLQNHPKTIHISMLNDFSPNAFASLEEGANNSTAHVYISWGLLQMIESESDLAFVIAHEIAHIKSNHFPLSFSEIIFTPKQLNHIAKVHQRWEHEADIEAINLLRERGYNQQSAIRMLERLATCEPTLTDSLLRSHPSINERLVALRTN